MSGTCTDSTRQTEFVSSLTIRNICPPTRKMEVTQDWYRMIEDVLQCPVCLKIADSCYIPCIRGHHMCGYCIKDLKLCPMCNTNFMPKPINHLVTNELTSKLSAIQLSITQEIESFTKKSQEDKSVQTDLLIANSSVNTQTDETNLLISAKESVYPQTCDDYSVRPNNNNGRKKIVNKKQSYLCLLCTRYNYFKTGSQLRDHLQEDHFGNLIKYDSSTVNIRIKFHFDSDRLPWECQHVLSTCSGNLYFVNILIRRNCYVKCYVCYVNESYTKYDSYRIYYSIKIEELVYKGEVLPYTSEWRIEDAYNTCFVGEDVRPRITSTPTYVLFELHNFK